MSVNGVTLTGKIHSKIGFWIGVLLKYNKLAETLYSLDML